jgi:hypothetical protein
MAKYTKSEISPGSHLDTLDPTEVISYCLGGHEIWNEAATVLEDCFTFASHIGKVEFTHYSRETNMVAHIIARNCFTDKISCNWDVKPPSSILHPPR